MVNVPVPTFCLSLLRATLQLLKTRGLHYIFPLAHFRLPMSFTVSLKPEVALGSRSLVGAAGVWNKHLPENRDMAHGKSNRRQILAYDIHPYFPIARPQLHLASTFVCVLII